MATADSAPEQATLILSATAAGEASRVCHQVAPGETLWRIASQLQSKEAGGSDTYSYLLALVQENRDRMAKGIGTGRAAPLLPESADSGAIRFPEPGPATAAVCPSGAGALGDGERRGGVPLGQRGVTRVLSLYPLRARASIRARFARC